MKRWGLTEEERQWRDAAICQAFCDGATGITLAKRFDVSTHTVWRALKQSGLCRRVMMQPKYQERDEAIREMILFGLTAKDIAFEFNLSTDHVHDILQRLGLNSASSAEQERERDNRNEAICEAFCNGASRDELVKEFNLHRMTICQILKAKGLVLSRPALPRRNADIHRAYASGVTLTELAERFRLTKSQICRILKDETEKRPAERAAKAMGGRSIPIPSLCRWQVTRPLRRR